MKRIIFTMVVLMTSLAALADSYFTTGENDTVRLDGSAMGRSVTLPFRGHFEGAVSLWWLQLTYPDGLTPVRVTEGEGLSLTYLNSEGQECVYTAKVTFNASLTEITSSVTVTGYMPYGSGYWPYGSATWPVGDHEDMFELTVKVPEGFVGGTLAIYGRLQGSGPDGIGGLLFYHTVELIVTLDPGDVNGDGQVNIGDVTALINILLTDEGQTPWCDVNSDSEVNIGDVTALINLLLTQ